MKFSIDVECTPQEARTFLGLPDVEAFQREMLELVKQRTTEHLNTMDPEAIMETWVPMGLETVNAMQKAFMQSFGNVSGDEPKSSG